MYLAHEPLITTIADSCRKCYTCVRECPAKAIRISDGRADVVTQRCIGCGNCVQVCSQAAKRVTSDVAHVRELIESGQRVAATIAPSFPAEFIGVKPEQIVGALRALGF
ncbi:MAG: 4Fe-4S binding protein, partial [Pseudomonadales bacterium]|nr:4Fe-4S binding protein [Pseudomonadales bacterium]